MAPWYTGGAQQPVYVPFSIQDDALVAFDDKVTGVAAARGVVTFTFKANRTSLVYYRLVFNVDQASPLQHARVLLGALHTSGRQWLRKASIRCQLPSTLIHLLAAASAGRLLRGVPHLRPQWDLHGHHLQDLRRRPAGPGLVWVLVLGRRHLWPAEQDQHHTAQPRRVAEGSHCCHLNHLFRSPLYPSPRTSKPSCVPPLAPRDCVPSLAPNSKQRLLHLEPATLMLNIGPPFPLELA